MTALLLTASLQALLTPEDAVLSDELNHASIIDGIRLCKAHKYRYRHLDVADLEAKLQEAQVGQGLVVPGAWTGLSLHLGPPRKESRLGEAHSSLTGKRPESSKEPRFEVPVVAQRVKNPTSIHEDVVPSLASLCGCGVGRQLQLRFDP